MDEHKKLNVGHKQRCGKTQKYSMRPAAQSFIKAKSHYSSPFFAIHFSLKRLSVKQYYYS